MRQRLRLMVTLGPCQRALRSHLIAIAALSLGLTACGNQDPQVERPNPAQTSAIPAETPQTTNSAAGAPTQSPTQNPTRPSLTAFAKAWIAADLQMQLTGNPREYRKFVSPDCAACTSYIQMITAIHKSGGWIKVDSYEYRRIANRRPFDNRVTFRLITNNAQTTYKETKASPVQTLPGGVETLEVTVIKRPTHWAVVDYLNATRAE